ncbi:MAG: glutamyl-tRNA amidotransferase [Deltaproteobacteria bacterium RIFCSPLOWO2_01_44_7]|nr:MAG: glutamyl-tRNA amidotransferase [Deltaproteobacteria bacterium RIFCSPHIGHO2_01_FULL_43_49]OGQ14606.1 MAG: glutamyl-tRNA amidotransferase [Deltaproteobacteria bacterium RIFCSPHIGHO2_02_FULL_44_53]OGQ27992.1 MAG: glutamyl-tRNA amidotransferase [Deltaproteobacteria bacterium RIFCSPHIGHO2_12_FULL_44_21]OGQ31204.1 MAG: glutamyl-tRNA amidotransferase [Deltaproteobacteria bacterium RIFCSPLOWO2_01_FULL_45_74]OGQ37968.1 MAG: glutamyl-tRNA amidotransferase [Deltaproteobacteria bacterium RIFCSPLOWO
MPLKNKIEEDFKQAVRGKETLKVSCLRLIKAAIQNKEIDVRGKLDDSQILSILSTLAKQRKESIEQFKKGGRNDLVKNEEAELKLIETYLPKALDEAALAKIIEQTIAEVGGQGAKDVGKVMKAVMPKIAGQADGRVVNQLVLKKLGTS